MNLSEPFMLLTG